MRLEKLMIRVEKAGFMESIRRNTLTMHIRKNILLVSLVIQLDAQNEKKTEI